MKLRGVSSWLAALASVSCIIDAVLADEAGNLKYPAVTGIERGGGELLRVEWAGNADGRFQVEATDQLGKPFEAISSEISGFSFDDNVAGIAQRFYRVVDLTLGPPFETASSLVDRVEPKLEPGELSALTEGNGEFALRFYRRLAVDSDSVGANLFVSPYSVSLAFAMTYAGARGDTAEEMQNALGFTLEPDRIHESFNALAGELESRGASIEKPEERFRFNVVNETWGQKGFSFEERYLDTLAMHYGAGMNLLDFPADPDRARQTINDWVAGQTEDRIKDLMPEGSVDEATRLVLTNAIYFKASWHMAFSEARTGDRPFSLPDGSKAMVETMTNRWNYPVGGGSGVVAVELPYKGEELGMLILMPTKDSFETFEAELDSAEIDTIARSLKPTDVDLSLPKFQFAKDVRLNQIMMDLGMRKAFERGQADFSGISKQADMFIQAAVHKSFISIDESGTEAAAATGISIGIVSAPPPLRIDRPFLFLIRDRATGTILFMGRVLDPRSS